MGLPVTACGSEQRTVATVDVSAEGGTPQVGRDVPSASSLPSASASETVAPEPTQTATATATATAITTATATPTVKPPRGLSNVPHFTTEYPHQNNRGCSTATAHCYMLSDLRKMASAGATCPASEDVPQGCMGGSLCIDPDARTTGPLLQAVSQKQTAEKHGAACCYEVPDLCCAGCGRALRDGDRTIVTKSTRRSDWRAEIRGLAPDEARARRYAEMAGAEHASIASFARTSLDLLALGAPADLLAETHRAALDEIEHARIAYALASELSGEPLGPSKVGLPPHAPATFASLAESTFFDACVGESLGADDLRALAASEEPRVSALLERIAEDEERHVEVAFRTLAWCVRAGGEEARRALERAIDRASSKRAVITDVVLPCARALLAHEPPKGDMLGACASSHPRRWPS